MRKIISVFIISILLLSFLSFSYAQQQDKVPFQLTLVIPERYGLKERQISKGYSGNKPDFHVLLKNISDKPQKIWEERCSWGYDNLSFELLIDNEKIIIKKGPRGWDKNFPAYSTINPNEYYILDVYIFSDEWKNFPKVQKKTSAQLKAIYEFPEFPEEDLTSIDITTGATGAKLDIWQGKIESKPVDIFIYD